MAGGVHVDPAGVPGASADVVRTRADADALQRPPLVVLETLEAYLDEQGIGSGPADVIALPGGHSNATFLLRRQGCEAVLRRPPRPPIPPGANDVVREARVMAALEGVLGAGAVRTPDLGGTAGTGEVGDELVRAAKTHPNG